MLKLKKMIIGFALMLALVLPADAQTARSMNFRDVSPDDWYYPFVKRLYEDWIINGVADDLYAPDWTVRTSEVAALITRYLGLESTARQRRGSLPAESARFWYAGYIQVLYELNILDAPYLERLGLRLNANGRLIISNEAAALIDAPISRMDVVKLIARSFQIRSDTLLRTNRLLPSEVSGSGNEFITGGGYDWTVFHRIAENKITDYDDIPESYRVYFLKLFYNGIIGGNGYGQVLPHDNLRRSELARIIASVLHFDMRTGDLRELPEVSVITPEDFVVSSVDGSRFLRRERAVQILREQAAGISVSVYGGNINIRIEQRNIIPMGFLNEIYVYRYDGGFTSEAGRVNSAVNAGVYFPRESSFTIMSEIDPVGYVYLILRDLTRGGEIAGALMLNIGADGSLREMPVH